MPSRYPKATACVIKGCDEKPYRSKAYCQDHHNAYQKLMRVSKISSDKKYEYIRIIADRDLRMDGIRELLEVKRKICKCGNEKTNKDGYCRACMKEYHDQWRKRKSPAKHSMTFIEERFPKMQESKRANYSGIWDIVINCDRTPRSY